MTRKKPNSMEKVIARLDDMLVFKVRLVPIKEYNDYMKMILTKGYEIHFEGTRYIIYKARNANEVKRFASGLMDLLNAGLLVTKDQASGLQASDIVLNDDVGDLA